tara:strand:- start:214 stop:969 length:756 start_codon:yes stop_codon:yes gene_type:complete
MKKGPAVSIVLPNYNSFKFINSTIKSIIKQSYTNWKLIIIDDCSDKKTRDLLVKITKNKKIKIYWLKKNRGAGYCRNLAVKKSHSKYIAFIDSDDIWKKNKLKNQINFMEKNNLDFTYTSYEIFGDKKKSVFPPEKLNYKQFLGNTSIATSTMILKYNIIKNAKFTNTEICEDYFFKCKILKNINYAYCLNKILTKYRIRRNSLQSNNLKNLYWIWNINKNFNKLNVFQNLISLFSISLNSFKRYGLKNLF